MKQCKKVTQELSEESLTVEGEFMSEEDMDRENYSAWLGCIYLVLASLCIAQNVVNPNTAQDPQGRNQTLLPEIPASAQAGLCSLACNIGPDHSYCAGKANMETGLSTGWTRKLRVT